MQIFLKDNKIDEVEKLFSIETSWIANQAKNASFRKPIRQQFHFQEFIQEK